MKVTNTTNPFRSEHNSAWKVLWKMSGIKQPWNKFAHDSVEFFLGKVSNQERIREVRDEDGENALCNSSVKYCTWESPVAISDALPIKWSSSSCRFSSSARCTPRF